MISRVLKIYISILSLATCSYAEDNNSKTVVQSQSASSVIGDLRKLNVDQNIITSDQDLEVFLTGFKHLQIGAIDKAQEIFTALQSSQDKDKKEYGEYGLLLFAYETENMFNMQRSLQRIETLERKSDWLGKELRNYEIYYNYNTANFTKSEEFLDLVPTSELIKSPFLSSVKADLYIRNNDLDKSKKVLTRLEHEGEDSVAMYAKLVYLSKGSQKAVNYLANKVTKYPNNESIQLIYNSYLSVINTEKSIDNAYKLGLQTENTYTLAYAIELLFPEAADSKTLEKLNTLNDKLNKSSVAKNYIDYYLIHIALPINDKEKSINLATANEFNPMNYRLLMHKYYSATDKEGQMQALHKLEKIDPYDNYILFELAKLYEINSMSKELAQVKQRFSDSKRFKTTEEIEFMNSIKIR